VARIDGGGRARVAGLCRCRLVVARVWGKMRREVAGIYKGPGLRLGMRAKGRTAWSAAQTRVRVRRGDGATEGMIGGARLSAAPVGGNAGCAGPKGRRAAELRGDARAELGSPGSLARLLADGLRKRERKGREKENRFSLFIKKSNN
jgi:hypothetical protein